MNGLFLLIQLNQLIAFKRLVIQLLKNTILNLNVYNTSLPKLDPLAQLNKVVAVFKGVLAQQLKFRVLVLLMQLKIYVLGTQIHLLVETKNAKIFLVHLMLLVRIQQIRTLKANAQLVKVANVLLFRNAL